MNNPNSEITQIGIIVIQSLNEEDRKTGDELNNDILRYKEYLHKDSFVEFYNVKTAEEFIRTLQSISNEMSEGKIFSLHIETHGSENGIHLASEECVTWKTFFDNIRPINIKMTNLLIITMAMCKGGALISFIDPPKRAPFLAFVGAFRNLKEDEVIRAFSAFYGSYTSALDIADGMKALDAEIDGINPKKKTFWCVRSSDLFDKVHDPDRNPIGFRKTVSKQLFNYWSRGEIHHTRANVENEIRNFLKESSVKHRDHFNFKDILK